MPCLPIYHATLSAAHRIRRCPEPALEGSLRQARVEARARWTLAFRPTRARGSCRGWPAAGSGGVALAAELCYSQNASAAVAERDRADLLNQFTRWGTCTQAEHSSRWGWRVRTAQGAKKVCTAADTHVRSHHAAGGAAPRQGHLALRHQRRDLVGAPRQVAQERGRLLCMADLDSIGRGWLRAKAAAAPIAVAVRAACCAIQVVSCPGLRRSVAAGKDAAGCHHLTAAATRSWGQHRRLLHPHTHLLRLCRLNQLRQRQRQLHRQAAQKCLALLGQAAAPALEQAPQRARRGILHHLPACSR